MKAHIQADPRAMLLWRFDESCPGYAGVLQAARAFRLTVRPLTEKDLTETVGSLCGMRGVTATDAGEACESVSPAPLAQPAMVICGLSHENGDLNTLITQVKKCGAEIPLKAMVTSTSKGWRLAHLLGELTAEHRALADGQAAAPSADEPATPEGAAGDGSVE